jgi:hypothetical protein
LEVLVATRRVRPSSSVLRRSGQSRPKCLLALQQLQLCAQPRHTLSRSRGGPQVCWATTLVMIGAQLQISIGASGLGRKEQGTRGYWNWTIQHKYELSTLNACSWVTGTRASSNGHLDHADPSGIHDTHRLRRRLRKFTFCSSMALHSFFPEFSHAAHLTTGG